MAPRKPEMDRRWGFLRPWCRALKDLITYKRVDREWEFWSDEKYFLEVKLPMRCGMTEDENGDEYEYGLDEWSGEMEFRAKFKKSVRRSPYWRQWPTWTKQPGSICSLIILG